MNNISEVEFSEDLLRGAAEIAEFLFGNRNKRRRVYHLAGHSKLPVFKMGSMLCARKSVLRRYVEQQEQRGNGPAQPRRLAI